MTRKSVSRTISKAPTLSSLGTWPWGMVLWTHTHPTGEAIFPGRTGSSSAGKSVRNEGQALPCPSLRTGVGGTRRVLTGQLKELPTCLGGKALGEVARESEETLGVLKISVAAAGPLWFQQEMLYWPLEGHSTFARLPVMRTCLFQLSCLFFDKQTKLHYVWPFLKMCSYPCGFPRALVS